MSVLSGWLDRILGRSSRGGGGGGGGAQATTADVRGGDPADAPVSAGDIEEGAHAARDRTIARDAPAQPPGAG
jgi:hypothetical protein